ncbi:MAG: hypothetical protein FD149_2181 [Rhodospirillaceae bacterium]|nr:MAG: hypothetical protein FD149_2181 [Rhodospirillaceae bacterium]
MFLRIPDRDFRKAVKMIRVLILAGMIVLGALPLWAEENFFDAIDDLPVMRGLQEIVDAVATFDTPDGRIVEAYAEGEKVTRAEVSRFYEQTLPQLGWVRSKPDQYRREGEKLRIDFIGKRPLTVRMTLAPE